MEKSFQKFTQFEFDIVVGSNMISAKKGHNQQIANGGSKWIAAPHEFNCLNCGEGSFILYDSSDLIHR